MQVELRKCKNRDAVRWNGMVDEVLAGFTLDADGNITGSTNNLRSASEGGFDPVDPSTLVTLLEPRDKVCDEIRSVIESYFNGKCTTVREDAIVVRVLRLIDEIAANPTR